MNLLKHKLILGAVFGFTLFNLNNPFVSRSNGLRKLMDVESAIEHAAESRIHSIEQSLSVWRERAFELVLKLSPAKIPDERRPFVLFHIRKGGGSTLRHIIHETAQKHNISSWIPCSNSSCIPFSLPPANRNLDVYAGHVNFVHMTQLFREIGTNNFFDASQTHKHIGLKDGTKAVVNAVDDSYPPLFDCMTNLRPTVSRVESCWNYRFGQDNAARTWRIPMAHNLTAQDWNALLPVTYDRYYNGCNNENARIFGSSADETVVNTLMPNDPIFLHEFEKAASRMSRCVIVMVNRCEESNAIIRHFFPWLSDTNLCGNKTNAAKTKGEKKVLHADASEAILSQNYIDELLFQFGEALFEAQLRLIRLTPSKALIRGRRKEKNSGASKAEEESKSQEPNIEELPKSVEDFMNADDEDDVDQPLVDVPSSREELAADVSHAASDAYFSIFTILRVLRNRFLLFSLFSKVVSFY
jgi:hypothetical protein